ncbi:MAG: Cephalosporin-C deacetylase [Candidatus Ordinivivax streblomastigis]|uniref:Cephalosporin-C deacetylase n=1 Tax=Candidatus Ordinivivax streblomastigis TaxID=2540710 RepID=A0A5M8NWS2_9BACT|nr:MAG: Cephalosporin-C deacetylase [Candidatus Ordinivivax streblomastigis]
MKKLNCITLLFVATLLGCYQQPKETITTPLYQMYSDAWKFHAGEGVDSLWQNPDYNDAAWQTVSDLKLLKDQNVALKNGFGRYRKTVQLNEKLQTALYEQGGITLHLAKFASAEEVYFNGQLVGKTGNFPPDYTGYNDGERSYFVREETIRPDSDNVIAIKFFDGWSAGGFLVSGTAEPFSLSSASTPDKVGLTIAVADSDYIFLSPEPVKVSARIENKNAWAVEGILTVKLTTDTYDSLTTYTLPLTIKGKTTCSDNLKAFNSLPFTPGFYRYEVSFARKDSTVVYGKKSLVIGVDPEKINSPIDAQTDFKEFWDNNLQELAKVKPEYKLTLQPEYSKSDYNIYLVEMRSFGNELIRGYYAQPKKEGKHPIIVEYMGYGSLPYPPNQTWDGFAYFILSIRGQALNLPYHHYEPNWITSGLDHKDNYYYRGAFMDVIRALDFVSSRPEIAADKIGVRGGSQGGALSFVAASLDKRVKAAAPNIPFLSDYRDYFNIAPWPKSDFDAYMQAHPEVKWDDIYTLLSYFDIKNLAQWISCPLIMGFGVQDNVCPPHINFAAYNQVTSEKHWVAGAEYGHSTGAAYYDEVMQFLKDALK